MKKTSNRRVIVISDLKSGYFEQAVFYIKENVSSTEDILVNEANNIISEYSKKYQVRKHASKQEQKYAAYKITAALSLLFAFFITVYCIFQ